MVLEPSLDEDAEDGGCPQAWEEQGAAVSCLEQAPGCWSLCWAHGALAAVPKPAAVEEGSGLALQCPTTKTPGGQEGTARDTSGALQPQRAALASGSEGPWGAAGPGLLCEDAGAGPRSTFLKCFRLFWLKNNKPDSEISSVRENENFQ